MTDAERLLDSRLYRAGRTFLELAEPVDRRTQRAQQRIRTLAGVVRRSLGWRSGTS